MKVICAGLSKTGTKSLASALRILGYKVYDFPEHIDIHLDEWLAIYRGEKAPDFVSMYEGVDGVTDLPAAFWYEEILEAFPEARIILTVRDDDEVWVQSWVKHLRMTRELGVFSKLAYLLCAKPRNLLDLFNAQDQAAYGSINPTATALFKKRYTAHTERVRALIPAEKLLVYNVKQGWDPLCQFLGVDAPSQEFPRENIGGSGRHGSIVVYGEELKHKIMYFLFPPLLILLSILVYLLFWNHQ